MSANQSLAKRIGRVLEAVTRQSGRLPETPAYGSLLLGRVTESQQRRRISLTGKTGCPSQSASRTQHDAHLVPTMRQSVAERVDSSIEVRLKLRRGQKNDPRCPE